jgi:glycosyltransferase involved in cell wall biosynthesis
MNSPETSNPTNSIVIPMRNEASLVVPLFDRLLKVLDRTGKSFEVLCVIDGGEDDTLDRILVVRESNPSIKAIESSRGFGKDAALMAGVDMAKGAAVVVMDCDLQHPPELIETMLDRWREG